MQEHHKEWYEQWEMFQDNELFLFQEWIKPVTLEDFKDKEVLECGCGGGQHTFFVAPYAKHITAVDLNTVDIAKERNRKNKNIEFVENDIAEMDLGKEYDIVFSIGVIHHTDSPDRTVANLKRHVKPGGKLILWVYSKEGNFLVRALVEPVKKLFLKKLPMKVLNLLSGIITALLYLPVYTIYLLPLNFLPYYQYFGNFRKLSFARNKLNVFDKLNAPQTHFISYQQAKRWLSNEFSDGTVTAYKNVSYTVIATRKSRVNP